MVNLKILPSNTLGPFQDSVLVEGVLSDAFSLGIHKNRLSVLLRTHIIIAQQCIGHLTASSKNFQLVCGNVTCVFKRCMSFGIKKKTLEFSIRAHFCTNIYSIKDIVHCCSLYNKALRYVLLELFQLTNNGIYCQKSDVFSKHLVKPILNNPVSSLGS